MRHVLFLLLMTFPIPAMTQVNATPDKETVLNDAEKRIVETDYRASHAVSARGSEGGGWQVDAGAVITARRIDLTLRNVQGVVRFRADGNALSEVFARSERRRLARSGLTP